MTEYGTLTICFFVIYRNARGTTDKKVTLLKRHSITRNDATYETRQFRKENPELSVDSLWQADAVYLD